MKMTQLTRRAAAMVGALALIALPASADTLNVPKGGSIQKTIAEAQPGDTIVVPSGTYAERLEISYVGNGGGDGVSLHGLTLQGKGKVILDVRGDGYGPGIRVTADDVTISGLTIKNCVVDHDNENDGGGGDSTQGVGIYADGVSNLTLSRVDFVFTTYAAIYAPNINGLTVDRCNWTGTEYGVYAHGSNMSFTGCGAYNTDAAFYLEGQDILISKCKVADSSCGVYFDNATDITVEKCKSERSEYFIEGYGNDVHILNNKADAIIYLSGSQDTDGEQDPWAFSIIGNKITSPMYGVVYAHGVHNLVMTGNSARNSGMVDWYDDDEYHAFMVEGDNMLISGNKSVGGPNSAFYIEGSGCTITKNKASKHLRDGLKLAKGEQCLVDGNVLTSNGGEGLEIGNVFGTTVTNNKASKNRIDFAISAENPSEAVTTLSGNKFGNDVGAPGEAPQGEL